MAPVGEDALTVFVGGLPKGLTTDGLQMWGSQFGAVARTEIKLDPQGQPRGFGFIYFQDTSSVQLALDNKDNNMIEGKWVDCKPVQPSSSARSNKGSGKAFNDPNNPKLFVGGLPRGANQESIKAHFSNFGAVKDVEVRLHQDGSCQGFAFVLFEDAGSARLVFDNHETNYFEGKWIDCKSAVEKPAGKGYAGSGGGRAAQGGYGAPGGYGGKYGGKGAKGCGGYHQPAYAQGPSYGGYGGGAYAGGGGAYVQGGAGYGGGYPGAYGAPAPSHGGRAPGYGYGAPPAYGQGYGAGPFRLY